MLPHLFLLLPALASCSIYVNIQTFDNHSDPKISLKGDLKNFITYKEQVTFQLLLTKRTLHKAAQKYINAEGTIKEAFLRNPNLSKEQIDKFNSIGYQTGDVYRRMAPSSHRLLCVSETVIAKQYEGNGTNETSYIDFSKIKVQVDNTFKTRLLGRINSFDIKDSIIYSLKGLVDISFSSPWKANTSMVKPAHYVSEVWDTLALKTGQVPEITLYATKVTLKLRITYTATLVGSVTGIWAPQPRTPGIVPPTAEENKVYMDRRIMMPINSLLKVANLPQSLDLGQLITIECYTKGTFVVTDEATNEKLAEVPAVLS